MHHPTRIPHFLRLTILLLRIVIGLHFFALGFGRLFRSTLFPDPATDAALAGISHWLLSLSSPFLASALSWTLLVVGAGIILGLATRSFSFIAILIAGFAYFQNFTFSAPLLTNILNNQLIVLISLGILFFGRAGSYLGFDTLFHFSPWRRR